MGNDNQLWKLQIILAVALGVPLYLSLPFQLAFAIHIVLTLLYGGCIWLFGPRSYVEMWLPWAVIALSSAILYPMRDKAIRTQKQNAEKSRNAR